VRRRRDREPAGVDQLTHRWSRLSRHPWSGAQLSLSVGWSSCDLSVGGGSGPARGDVGPGGLAVGLGVPAGVERECVGCAARHTPPAQNLALSEAWPQIPSTCLTPSRSTPTAMCAAPLRTSPVAGAVTPRMWTRRVRCQQWALSRGTWTGSGPLPRPRLRRPTVAARADGPQGIGVSTARHRLPSAHPVMPPRTAAVLRKETNQGRQ
jgi:hypothetical protein